MLGWEFPPFISGGLGTACYGLTKAMSGQGTRITFVLPFASQADCDYMNILTAQGIINSKDLANFKNLRFKTVSSSLKPYNSFGVIPIRDKKSNLLKWLNPWGGSCQNYGQDVFEQVYKYAEQIREIASAEKFDIIHGHDWMTFPAVMTAAQETGRPAVIHIHSTEFDRSGEHVNQTIYDIERKGMHDSKKIIAVSNYTKNIIVNRYSVPADKIEVVYNGVEGGQSGQLKPADKDKIILYLGRITFQKGPDYFVAAAKKVLEKMKNVKFIMAGDGDMTHRMIEYAAYLGIGHKVFFTRFLRGSDVNRVYRMADLYVMPSVSEPFGIAALEAMKNKVPVLVSKQSGIAEAARNILKVDFWDVEQIANKIAAVLKHQPLRTMLGENGFTEAGRFRWENSAAKINEIYKQVIACA
jgi:glycosyltransferase involved in cell wall biosynthesis